MLIAAISSAVFVALAEYLNSNGNEKTSAWLYGAGAVLHGGAAVLNSGQMSGGASASASTKTTSTTITTASLRTGPPSAGKIRLGGVPYGQGRATLVR
jgi:hypothetical protein